MKLELKYLRDELNQLCDFYCKQTNNVINRVLITWGSALTVFGMFMVKSTRTSHEDIIFCFIEATIFFISNVILYFLARNYHSVANATFRLAGYILVFYEKRLSETVKVGKNFSWELANIEINIRKIGNNETENRNSFFRREDYYKVLIFISFLLITLFSISLSLIIIFSWTSFWAVGNIFSIIYIIMSLICVFYAVFSIYLFRIVPKYTALKDDHKMRLEHLKDYFQYALDIRYYTPDDIKNRFGDFYEKCKQYS